MQFLRDDAQDRLSDDLVRAIAEDAFSRRIPRADGAIERFADDGIIRALDEGGQIGMRALGVLIGRALGGEIARRWQTKLRVAVCWTAPHSRHSTATGARAAVI